MDLFTCPGCHRDDQTPDAEAYRMLGRLLCKACAREALGRCDGVPAGAPPLDQDEG